MTHAENAWRIAMEAAAEPAYGMATDWWYRASDYVGEDIKRLSERIASLPMPPAFRAEVEAETEELRGMLARMVDHADAFDHGEAMLSYGGDVAEARALLSRLEAKGESHE